MANTAKPRSPWRTWHEKNAWYQRWLEEHIEKLLEEKPISFVILKCSPPPSYVSYYGAARLLHEITREEEVDGQDSDGAGEDGRPEGQDPR